MSEEMTTLGESCQFFNGKAHEKDIDAEGAYVVVNSKFISRDGNVRKYTGKQMFPLFEDDIVMVMSDVPNGKALAKCYIIEDNNKYSLNQRICAIRTTGFNIRFLYYQLNRHPYFLAFNNGENQSNLRKADILNCPLWQPSMEVQENIVELLDEALEQIDQAKANIKKNIVNAKELFQSKLNDIFSKKGDGWEEKTLAQVCEIRPPKKISKDKLNDNDLVSFVPMKYLEVNQMYFSSEETKTLEQAYSGYVYFQEGDVILAKITPCFENGKLGIAKDLENEIGFGSSEYVVYRVDKNKLSAEFLYFFLNRENFRIKGKSLMSGAVGHKRIQPSFYENEIIYLPSITIQNNVLDSITTLQINLNQIESNYSKKLDDLEKLKKSILQKVFAGELTKKAVSA
jgi:type I restriction enzyme S subunit